MTTITPEALIAAGYQEFRPPPTDNADRMFQRRVTDDGGTRYFVTFRMWTWAQLGHPPSFDAAVHADTDTGGYVWVTIREASIEATEARAAAIWQAAGAVYYERSEANAG